MKNSSTAVTPINANRIYLIGLMGVGKTTVGKWLARQLDYTFLDTDAELQKKTGADIPLIFEMEGEEGFRLREASILKQLSNKQKTVIATGGGIVLNQENTQIMQNSGLVVYLHAPVDLLLERTQFSKHRPLLEGGNRRTKIESLLNERDTLYRKSAHLIIRTKRGSPRRLASKLIKEIAKYEKNNG